jgi:D-serine deaminase-like pyridoxal phosphate-dependent protein
MNRAYLLSDPASVYSPGLLFYKDLIRRNIAEVLRIAGSPGRVRPHVKTHKTREIVRMEMEMGIVKQKCATLAEAEMVAGCGVEDVFLAYPIVGPNCARLGRLIQAYPKCRFSVTADHPAALRALSDTLSAAGQSVDVLLDVDCGQHRTGIAAGPEAVELYEQFAKLPGIRPGGFHVYDGHNHQENAGEREKAVKALLDPVLSLRERVEKKGLPVPRFVVGGTPTFPVFARLDLPGLECSPGTCILHDHGYGTHFPDMAGFTPAALLLTRVISRPLPNRLTLDLGYKAVASDPPAGQRCILLNVPDYKPVLQNEEHFVVETPAADKFAPGDVVYAMPTHICPTCALHRKAYVVENGRVTEQWEIIARDRVLTV